MDQRGSTYSKRRTAILEPGRGELHTEPHVRPISCHVASLSSQEPEEELNKLLMKVSDRDRNVKVKMLHGCVEVIVFLQRLQCEHCGSHCKRCTSYSNSVRLCTSYNNSVRLSVCPSACHTPVLCQNDCTQHDAVCTVR